MTSKNQIDDSKLLPVVSRWADNSRRTDNNRNTNDQLHTLSMPRAQPKEELVGDGEDPSRTKTELLDEGVNDSDRNVVASFEDTNPIRGVACSSIGDECIASDRFISDMAEDISEGDLDLSSVDEGDADMSERAQESTSDIVKVEACATYSPEDDVTGNLAGSGGAGTVMDVGGAHGGVSRNSRTDSSVPGVAVACSSESTPQNLTGTGMSNCGTGMSMGNLNKTEGGISTSPKELTHSGVELSEDPVLLRSEHIGQPAQEDEVGVACEGSGIKTEESSDKEGEIGTCRTDEEGEIGTCRTDEGVNERVGAVSGCGVTTEEGRSTEQSVTEVSNISTEDARPEGQSGEDFTLAETTGEGSRALNSTLTEESKIEADLKAPEGTVSEGEQETGRLTQDIASAEDVGFVMTQEGSVPKSSEGIASAELSELREAVMSEGRRSQGNNSEAHTPQVENTEGNITPVSLASKPLPITNAVTTAGSLSELEARDVDFDPAAVEMGGAETQTVDNNTLSDPLNCEDKGITTSLAEAHMESEPGGGHHYDYRARLVGVLKESASLSDISQSSVPEVAVTVEGADESSMDFISVAASQACEDICNPSSIMRGANLRRVMETDPYNAAHCAGVESDGYSSSQSDAGGLTPPRLSNLVGKKFSHLVEDSVGVSSETSSWSVQSEPESSTNFMRGLIARNRNISLDNTGSLSKSELEYSSDSSQSYIQSPSETLGPSSLCMSVKQDQGPAKQWHVKEGGSYDIKEAFSLTRNSKLLLNSDSLSSICSSNWSQGGSSYKESDGSLKIQPRRKRSFCKLSGEGVTESPVSTDIEESEEAMDETEGSDAESKEEVAFTGTKLMTVFPLLHRTVADELGSVSNVNEGESQRCSEVGNEDKAMEEIQGIDRELLETAVDGKDLQLATNSDTIEPWRKEEELDGSNGAVIGDRGDILNTTEGVSSQSAITECSSDDRAIAEEEDDVEKSGVEGVSVCGDNASEEEKLLNTSDLKDNGEIKADGVTESVEKLEECVTQDSGKIDCDVRMEFQEEGSEQSCENQLPLSGSGSPSGTDMVNGAKEDVEKEELKLEKAGLASDAGMESSHCLDIDLLDDREGQSDTAHAVTDDVVEKEVQAMETEAEAMEAIEPEGALGYEKESMVTEAVGCGDHDTDVMETQMQDIAHDTQDTKCEDAQAPEGTGMATLDLPQGEDGKLGDEEEANLKSNGECSTSSGDVEAQDREEQVPRNEESEGTCGFEEAAAPLLDVPEEEVNKDEVSRETVGEKPSICELISLSNTVGMTPDMAEATPISSAVREAEMDVLSANEECGNESEAGTGSSTEGEGEIGDRKGSIEELSEECQALQEQVKEAARELLVKWAGLKEIFRIPKKASKPVSNLDCGRGELLLLLGSVCVR